jgi:hypothetical protein
MTLTHINLPEKIRLQILHYLSIAKLGELSWQMPGSVLERGNLVN